MKKIFKEAHKMTREMVKKYGVDYQAQFSLNLSYLFEKEEEGEMLDKEIKKRLQELKVSKEEIERIEKVLKDSSGLTNELIEDIYDDKDSRRILKARGLWNSKDFGIEMKERYLGEGKVKIVKQNLWENYGKVRVYFNVALDESFTTKYYTTVK